MEISSHYTTLEKSRKYPTSHVLDIEDEFEDKLWEELKQERIEAQLGKEPPLEEIDFDKKKLILELISKQVDVGF